MSDTVNLIPKTYLDRQGASSGTKYLFISYSHKNQESVYDDLNKLYDSGLNYWYDSELHNGDIWCEIVEQRLADSNCVGAIFFLDVNCILGGGAIEKEILLFEKYKQIRKDLFSFCVISSEDESVYSIVRKAFISCADLPTKQLQAALPESRVLTVLKYFNQDKIYKLRSGDYINEIVDDVRKQCAGAVSDSKTFLQSLKGILGGNMRQSDEGYEISFGEYPSEEYFGGRDFVMVGDTCTLPSGDRIKQTSKGLYIFKPVRWLLVDSSESSAFLIAKNILDISKGDSETVDLWLKNFSDVAFSDEEKALIDGQAFLPSVEDLKKLEGKLTRFCQTKYAASFDRLSFNFAWLSDMVAARKRKIIYSIDNVVNVDFNFIDTDGGVMPALKIKIN